MNDEIRRKLRLKTDFDNSEKIERNKPIPEIEPLLEKCFAQDEDLSLNTLKDFNYYLYSLSNEEDFEKICEVFPYDIFLQFLISLPKNLQRKFALLLFSQASASESFPIEFSQDENVLAFFSSLLSSDQTDEIDSSLFIISRLISMNPECAEYFVNQNIHSKLQFINASQNFARLLAVLSEYHIESLPRTLELIPLCFNVHDNDTQYFALLALKFAVENVPDLAELVLSMILNYSKVIFDFQDFDVVNQRQNFFKTALEILLEVEIAPPQFTKLILYILLSSESKELNQIALAVLRHHKAEWCSEFENLCFILRAQMDSCSFELQKSYFATILMYFQWDNEIDSDLIAYLGKFLEDADLKKPCMIVLEHIAQYFLVDNPKNVEKEVLDKLHDYFLSEIVPNVSQIVSNDDDPELVEKATHFLAILDN